MSTTIPDESTSEFYDVVVIGGAIAGAAAALLLKREQPSLRVLVVEKRDAFDAKVGEATTEMSAMFLTRRLALWQHLELEHLPKEGLRYWSNNDHVTGHGNASETGGFLRSTVPAFQLRRDTLDEHVLKLATEEGAELVRPARIKSVELKPFRSNLTVTQSVDGVDTERAIECTWVIDASGRACFLGKQLKLIDWNDEHPIASIWSRWTGVRHIDDVTVRTDGKLAGRNVSSRRLATNHYIGHGYWIWVIPLGNGQTSVGVVFDKRIHRLHEAPDRLTTFTTFLNQHPALAELLQGATPDTEDLRGLSRVAYLSRQYMGDGWALVGDAAAFIDPYYSPGLDHVGFSVEATVDLVLAHARGETAGFAGRIKQHNNLFNRSYRWFFRCVYKDKYYLMGEHDLISASFLVDTALYYIFLVVPAYRFLKRFRSEPVLGPKQAYPSYYLLRFMKWRFIRIAALRRQVGEAGRRNNGRRIKAFYNLNLAPGHMALRGVKLWIYAEIDAVRLKAKSLFKRELPAVTTELMPART